MRGGWLPPKTAGEDEFPFIIVRPRSGTDGEADGRLAADIIVGTYSDTDDGHHEVLALIDAIRLSLGAEPVAGGAFECVRPLAWELPEEQTRPQWLGRVTTTWIVPLPERIAARGPAEEQQ